MQFPHQKYPFRLWMCLVWQVLTMKLSQLILRSSEAKAFGVPTWEILKRSYYVWKIFSEKNSDEDVTFKATVSQGFEERLLQQWLSVLRQMKRQTIIRSDGDFMTWNLELQLGCVAPADWFGVMNKIETNDLPPHPSVL